MRRSLFCSVAVASLLLGLSLAEAADLPMAPPPPPRAPAFVGHPRSVGLDFILAAMPARVGITATSPTVLGFSVGVPITAPRSLVAARSELIISSAVSFLESKVTSIGSRTTTIRAAEPIARCAPVRRKRAITAGGLRR